MTRSNIVSVPINDERLTAALLDRLTHRAHILEFLGDSHRFRQRMQKETAEKEHA